MIGQILDRRYRLDAELGSGGMGVVYRATHVLIGKPVAVKVLRHEQAADPEVRQRFLREAQIATAIKHGNIVDLNDFGELPDGRIFYVMELLEGQPLSALVAQGPIEPRRALGIAMEIARGLHAAHQVGVVHRDLKPDNVYLVGSDNGHDRIKLFDFGIARAADSRLTRPGAVLGTPEYMAPEQATGSAVDHRADLYALGAMLFEMLTGDVPFPGVDIAEVLRGHLTTPAPALRQVAPQLSWMPTTETLVAQLLAKDPAERPRDAVEVQRRLAEAIGADLVGRERATLEIGSGSVAAAVAEMPSWPTPPAPMRATEPQGLVHGRHGSAPIYVDPMSSEPISVGMHSSQPLSVPVAFVSPHGFGPSGAIPTLPATPPARPRAHTGSAVAAFLGTAVVAAGLTVGVFELSNRSSAGAEAAAPEATPSNAATNGAANSGTDAIAPAAGLAAPADSARLRSRAADDEPTSADDPAPAERIVPAPAATIEAAPAKSPLDKSKAAGEARPRGAKGKESGVREANKGPTASTPGSNTAVAPKPAGKSEPEAPEPAADPDDGSRRTIDLKDPFSRIPR